MHDFDHIWIACAEILEVFSYYYNVERVASSDSIWPKLSQQGRVQGLEWTLPSPAPYHSFTYPPEVTDAEMQGQ